VPLTDDQKEQLEAALKVFGGACESLEAKAIAYKQSREPHLRNCGKHFDNAVRELRKGVTELEETITA
jgi:hypothetical protein